MKTEVNAIVLHLPENALFLELEILVIRNNREHFWESNALKRKVAPWSMWVPVDRNLQRVHLRGDEVDATAALPRRDFGWIAEGLLLDPW